MRFRGKRIHFGEWAYGYYHKNTLGNSYITEITQDNSAPCSPKPKDSREYKVDPQTVSQYIGVKGSNGYDIFVGDIVKDDTNIAIVKFGKYQANNNRSYSNERAYGFYLEFISHKGIIDHATNLEYYEVIGNIHDNPELLKAD